MSKEKILIIEDEEHLLELIRYNLEKEGFKVLLAATGAEGLETAQKQQVDLILLDLMLPEIDGSEVCKILKRNEKTHKIPIVMVTARGEESDRIAGFDIGADDYITKPFSPRELIARVKAVLRRVYQLPPAQVIKAGTLEVDGERHRATLKGKPLELTAKEYRLLQTLMAAQGRLLSRNFLLEEVWGYGQGAQIETRTVDMHIGQLRKKIKNEAQRIVTVKNAGYRFESNKKAVL